jgi:hypothetical protein
MSAPQRPTEIDVTDTSTLEVVAYGVARIDGMGGMSRIIFYTPKRYSGGQSGNEAVVHVTVPTEQVPAIAAALAAFGGRPTPNIAHAGRTDDEATALH